MSEVNVIILGHTRRHRRTRIARYARSTWERRSGKRLIDTVTWIKSVHTGEIAGVITAMQVDEWRQLERQFLQVSRQQFWRRLKRVMVQL